MRHTPITAATHSFESAPAITVPLSWGDLVALARSNHVLGIHWITRLRDEAQDLAAKRYADWRAQNAIAQAAQGYIDVHQYPEDARLYLEELDALIFGDKA